MLQFFLAVLEPTLFILAGNNDINESLDEFEILPDLPQTTELAAL